MFCVSCGQRLRDCALFCPHCGSQVGEVTASRTTAAAGGVETRVETTRATGFSGDFRVANDIVERRGFLPGAAMSEGEVAVAVVDLANAEQEYAKMRSHWIWCALLSLLFYYLCGAISALAGSEYSLAGFGAITVWGVAGVRSVLSKTGYFVVFNSNAIAVIISTVLGIGFIAGIPYCAYTTVRLVYCAVKRRRLRTTIAQYGGSYAA